MAVDLNQQVDISVVILTKNGGPRLREVLTQVLRQDTELTFEVIIVDRGSTDETLKTIHEFPVRKFMFPANDSDFGRARNYGFSMARGEYIATISQDATPSCNRWLHNLVQPFFSNPNVAAVQGVESYPEDRPLFWWWRHGGFFFTSESSRWLSTYGIGLSFVNCAIRKSFWVDHPILPTPWAEDKLFQRSIVAAGRDVILARDAVCIHGHDYTLANLLACLRAEGSGWKYAGVRYGLKDCLLDVLRHRNMFFVALRALFRGEIRSAGEVFFVLLRPTCLFWGNRVNAPSWESGSRARLGPNAPNPDHVPGG